MAKCSRCGQTVTTAPIICEKCQGQSVPAELESFLQLICEQYCVHPYEAADQIEIDGMCANCELRARLQVLTAGRCKGDDDG